MDKQKIQDLYNYIQRVSKGAKRQGHMNSEVIESEGSNYEHCLEILQQIRYKDVYPSWANDRFGDDYYIDVRAVGMLYFRYFKGQTLQEIASTARLSSTRTREIILKSVEKIETMLKA